MEKLRPRHRKQPSKWSAALLQQDNILQKKRSNPWHFSSCGSDLVGSPEPKSRLQFTSLGDRILSGTWRSAPAGNCIRLTKIITDWRVNLIQINIFYVWMVTTSLFWSLPSSSSPGRLQFLLEGRCARLKAGGLKMCACVLSTFETLSEGFQQWDPALISTPEQRGQTPAQSLSSSGRVTKMRTNYSFGELLSQALFCLFSLYW